MRLSFWSLLLALSLLAPTAAAERTHVVASGHTLGKIAKRYHVTIAALCTANGIQRSDAIRPGQKLIVPDASDKDGKKARDRHQKQAKAAPPRASDDPPKAQANAGSSDMLVMNVPGVGNVFYYEPTGPGRLTLRPVLMYLHGRGGQPQRDCKRWARVARRVGWLVCPSGPGANGIGRGWNNNWVTAHAAATKTLNALRKKYGRRVQLYGNTLIGFSEGAYAAMNVGVREPRAFNRWLILAGNSTYWGPLAHERLDRARGRLRKVYLITGEKDGVIQGTRSVREILRRAKVSTRISTPGDMGHELALDSKGELYRAALVWLNQG